MNLIVLPRAGESLSINWYPGHMRKARRTIREHLRACDIALEVLDARIPYTSRNPDIDELLHALPRVVVLNKTDLADPVATRAWVAIINKQGHAAVPVRALDGSGIPHLVQEVRRVLEAGGRTPRGRMPRAVVVGIPNVGKSALINALAARHVVPTGRRPGITRGKQWIRVGPYFELLDTPGILWPRLGDREAGYKLAAVGAIREEVLPVREVALWLVKWLATHQPRRLAARYDVLGAPPDEILIHIAQRRGFLLPGGQPDEDRAALAVLKDFRDGRLGRVTLDLPEEAGA